MDWPGFLFPFSLGFYGHKGEKFHGLYRDIAWMVTYIERGWGIPWPPGLWTGLRCGSHVIIIILVNVFRSHSESSLYVLNDVVSCSGPFWKLISRFFFYNKISYNCFNFCMCFYWNHKLLKKKNLNIFNPPYSHWVKSTHRSTFGLNIK